MGRKEKQDFPKVIVFTTPTCPHCKHAKRYLRKKNVPFRDVDVSRDRAAARDMARRSGQQGVPVVDIGGQVVVGFNRRKIDRMLGI